MFASTSRTVLRSSLGKAPAFSTSACARRTIIVELLQDVPGLGNKFDMVRVASGRARHGLIPYRLARWVPGGVKAEWRAPKPSDDPQLAVPGADGAEAAAVSSTSEALIAALQALPPALSFARLTVAPNSPAIHGSVTLADVAERLAAEHELPATEVEVHWATHDASTRIKELGSWDAEVRVRGAGGESVPIEIEVVRGE